MGVSGPEDVERLKKITLKHAEEELKTLPSEISIIILSNEHIHGRVANRIEAQRLRDFVLSFCESCKIIVYLRRQDKLAVSLYSTRFRAGATDLSTVFPTHFLHFYDYKNILTTFSDVFGRENIIPKLFDRSAFVGGDLISDFCAEIGLRVDDTFRRPTELNLPLKPEAICPFAEFNKHIPRFVEGRLNPDFVVVLNAFDSLFCGHGPITDRISAQHFYKQFAGGNEFVRQQYFPTRDPPLFGEDFSDYPVSLPNMTYTYGDAVRLSADLIRFLIKRYSAK